MNEQDLVGAVVKAVEVDEDEYPQEIVIAFEDGRQLVVQSDCDAGAHEIVYSVAKPAGVETVIEKLVASSFLSCDNARDAYRSLLQEVCALDVRGYAPRLKAYPAGKLIRIFLETSDESLFFGKAYFDEMVNDMLIMVEPLFPGSKGWSIWLPGVSQELEKAGVI